MNQKLIIIGARGRMGEALVRLAPEKKFEMIAGLEQGDRLEDVVERGEVIIEFAHPSATLVTAQCAARHCKPLVIGTTGHSLEERERVLKWSQDIPMIFSPNYSIGVNVLFDLTQRATQLLGDTWDVEIIEVHHRFKKDAPSGTAKKGLEIVAAARQEKMGKITRHGRVGDMQERRPSEIGVHAVRCGDVVGEHTVIFASMGERIELVHRATNRDIFACGALYAARWLIGKKPGLYEMSDVVRNQSCSEL